jgi:hypothetical protein
MIISPCPAEIVSRRCCRTHDLGGAAASVQALRGIATREIGVQHGKNTLKQ